MTASAVFCLRANVPEIYMTLSPAITVFPYSSYGAVAGGYAGLKAISGQFLFVLSLWGNYSAGKADVYTDGGADRAYGMYKYEWFSESEGSGAAAYYSAAGFSAGFGWNVLNLFAKRQFLCIEFGGRYEDEKIGEEAFHRFGRYHSEIYILTEVLEFDNFRVNLKLGAGGISCVTQSGPGFINYGLAGLEAEFDTMLFRITANRKPAEEGGAVWE